MMCNLIVFINGFPLPSRRKKISLVKQSQSDLRIVSKCFNVHSMLITTLSYSKFAIIQLQW